MSKGLLPRPNSLFITSYSPSHRTWGTEFILQNSSNPLYIARTRFQKERSRDGLWLDFTVGIASAKKSIVRNWIKRRLRNAFYEELKERGIGRDGKLMNTGICAQRRDALGMTLKEGKSDVYLKGSLKLHATKQMVAAEYKDVRRHTGELVDALVEIMSMRLSGNGEKLTRPEAKKPQRLRNT